MQLMLSASANMTSANDIPGAQASFPLSHHQAHLLVLWGLHFEAGPTLKLTCMFVCRIPSVLPGEVPEDANKQSLGAIPANLYWSLLTCLLSCCVQAVCAVTCSNYVQVWLLMAWV